MNGIILYEGPSQIDGKPIVAIATGLDRGARNIKTGPMVQVYIMRSDIDPMTAVETGDDVSICGSCRHRGEIQVNTEGIRKNVGRSCYVVLMHGPRVVYRSFERGGYKTVPLSVARRLLTGHNVRIGAYGDPAAVPIEVWNTALDKTKATTGYTHFWREHPEMSFWCMASCDTESEREAAKALGFRTFRVRGQNEPLMRGEGHCPASNEMGNATQCDRCLLCSGNRKPARADITVEVHGRGVKNFQKG